MINNKNSSPKENKIGRPKIEVSLITAERLKQQRKKHGETQEQLAKSMGYTKETIARYEKGKRGVPDEYIKKLAERWRVPLQFFYGETECDDYLAYCCSHEEAADIELDRQMIEEKQQIDTWQSLFAACGYQYKNLSYTAAEMDGLGLHRLTCIENPSLTIRLSDDELQELLDDIKDHIGYYCYKRLSTNPKQKSKGKGDTIHGNDTEA